VIKTEKGAENTLDNTNRPIYIDKTGKICLNIFAKPGSKENAIAGLTWMFLMLNEVFRNDKH